MLQPNTNSTVSTLTLQYLIQINKDSLSEENLTVLSLLEDFLHIFLEGCNYAMSMCVRSTVKEII